MPSSHKPTLFFPVVVLLSTLLPCRAAMISTVAELADAVNNGSAGDEIVVGEGTFELEASLRPKSNMTIRGAGMDKTTIAAASSWRPDTTGLPDNATDHTSVNRQAYIIDLGDTTRSITISDLTLTGPNLHGAVYGNNCDTLEIYNVRLRDFLWSSIRTFRMDNARIHDNEFIDAGGKFGPTGGALFMTWTADSEFWNNRITKTPGRKRNFYGFKGRKGNNCRFHHNTVLVNFSFEFPFENDASVEIDHNRFTGVISIPKHAGGTVPEGGYTFYIHHNWLSSSYALEWARNGAEVDHNLFDFDTESDGGNLISNFGDADCPGPTLFHDNLIKNPGRGLIWSKGVFNNYSFYNNHVIAHTTATPRTNGLFGLNSATLFGTIEIKDNIIECIGTARPLMRNTESYGAIIENNELTNISDTDMFDNPGTGATQGPREPLYFKVGVNGEYLVDGWEAGPVESGTTADWEGLGSPATAAHHAAPPATECYSLLGRRVVPAQSERASRGTAWGVVVVRRGDQRCVCRLP